MGRIDSNCLRGVCRSPWSGRWNLSLWRRCAGVGRASRTPASSTRVRKWPPEVLQCRTCPPSPACRWGIRSEADRWRCPPDCRRRWRPTWKSAPLAAPISTANCGTTGSRLPGTQDLINHLQSRGSDGIGGNLSSTGDDSSDNQVNGAGFGQPRQAHGYDGRRRGSPGKQVFCAELLSQDAGQQLRHDVTPVEWRGDERLELLVPNKLSVLDPNESNESMTSQRRLCVCFYHVWVDDAAVLILPAAFLCRGDVGVRDGRVIDHGHDGDVDVDAQHVAVSEAEESHKSQDAPRRYSIWWVFIGWLCCYESRHGVWFLATGLPSLSDRHFWDTVSAMLAWLIRPTATGVGIQDYGLDIGIPIASYLSLIIPLRWQRIITRADLTIKWKTSVYWYQIQGLSRNNQPLCSSVASREIQSMSVNDSSRRKGIRGSCKRSRRWMGNPGCNRSWRQTGRGRPSARRCGSKAGRRWRRALPRL